MERRKSHFRWYWFLERDVRLAVATGGGLFLVPPFLSKPYLVSALVAFLVLAMGAVGVYQRTLYDRMGADRVRSTIRFRVLWRVVAAIEMVALLALLLRASSFK
jgi:uncharacterized membrane protein